MPIDIHGKQYEPVAEMLVKARGERFTPPVGIDSIETEWVDRGNRLICIATVTFQTTEDRLPPKFMGSAEANSADRNPIAGNNPVETAETSAIGRALKHAGYGIGPSADEMLIAESRAASSGRSYPPSSAPEPRQAAPRPSFTPQSGSYPATDKQKEAVTKLAQRAGVEVDVQSMTKSEASEFIQQHGGGSWSR